MSDTVRHLREEYAELESLYRSAPVGLALIDRECRYVRINDRLAAINGRPAHEHLGRTIGEMVPEVAPMLEPLLRRVMATGEAAVDLEIPGKTSADPGVPHVWLGSFYPVTGRDRDRDVITGVSAVVHDITARNNTERILREANRRLQAILDGMFVFVGVLSLEGIVLATNQAPLELTGLSAGDVIGREVGDVYIFAYSTAVQRRIRAAVRHAARGEVVRYDEQLLVKDDAMVWLDIMISPIPDAEGRIVELVASATDITDRRRLSSRLLEVQEFERRALAHELHDEIGQALIAARLSLQTLEQFPHGSISSGRLRDAGAIVEHAIAQVRSLSLALRPPLLDDFGLVPALRSTLEQQASLAGLQSTFTAGDVPRLDPQVEIAGFRIAQEALSNAVRHAHAGTLTVDIALESETIRLRVADDGRGFNVAAARARAATGTSLGLVGMEERAALAGGGVEWRSSAAGTEVRAWFPARRRVES